MVDFGAIGRRALARLVLLALSLAMLAVAGQAAGTTAPKPAAAPSEPPMTVAVVRSSSPGCEPNCPQWIAAEGRITAQSPGLFKKALKLAGQTRLPVIITSPGGDVEAALAIGAMIRLRKLDVAVGWTLYSGCGPAQTDCELPKQQAGTFRGMVFTYRAYCASACPFILAAGQQRLLGPGAVAGVHQISTTMVQDRLLYREKYIIVSGKKEVISRTLISRKPAKSIVTTKLAKSLRRTLTAYLTTMGVGTGLLELFELAPPSSIHLLQPGEVTSTKLVTAFMPAGSLVETSLCQAATPAGNCVKLEPPALTP